MRIPKGMILGLLSCVGIGLFAGESWAQTQVVVLNGSFESPTVASVGYSNTPTDTAAGVCPTSWGCSVPTSNGAGYIGVVAPTSAQFNPSTDGVGAVVPDGSQALFVYSESGTDTVSQNSGIALAADTTYTFSVYVGNQTGGPFPGASIELMSFASGDPSYCYAGTSNNTPVDCGTAIAGSIDTIASITAGDWVDETVTYTTGDSVSAGETVGIGLSNTGNGTGSGEVFFDDVGSPTPEPASYLLFGSGLLVLGTIFRKKLGLGRAAV